MFPRAATNVLIVPALALLLSIGVVTGRAEARPLALEDYYRVVALQSPAMSPDGRWVAFIRTTIAESENRRQAELWIAPADGGGAARRLSDPSLDASSPRWSPDGRLLAYSTRRRGARPSTPDSTPRSSADAERDGGSIWFLQSDQLDRPAFHIKGVDGAPVFSPDNHWIAFVHRIDRPKPRQDASEAERLINERFVKSRGRAYEWLNYRFDQRGYLPDPRDPDATPPEELFIVPREGGEPRQLTRQGVNVRGATWRADSRALAFVANEFERDEYTYERADLWTVTLDGTTTRLTNDGHDHSSPAWSPDGRRIAVRRELGLSAVISSKQDHGAPIDIVTLPAAGGPPANLTADWDLLPGAPGWSPDGRYVYFPAGIGGNAHVFRVPSSGRPGDRVEQVTTGDRHLVGFSPSATFRTMAYVGTDSAHPEELFVASLESSSTQAVDGSGAGATAGAASGGRGERPRDERRLTAFNDALVKDTDLAAADPIHYHSKDGTEIEGWVMKPRGYDPSRASPLILTLHGGPHGAYGNQFSFEHQLFAANGYLVVYTNPRGSTNYGEKFLWATWGGGWGNLDVEDVMGGVDYALAHFHIDEQRLGVTGYSYGGFLTNWIIGHTTRFAAAITGAGISNWISDYATADIPRTKESEFFGPPWDPRAHELLRRQSPIEYVVNVRTPTLFVHGESDMRVPIEEGEQMYVSLKKLRVPARFVRYADSYHGGWSPWNTVHRYHEELQWWTRWLGRP